MNRQRVGGNVAPESVDVRFVCNVKPDAKSVFLAGDFNGWNPSSERMRKRGGSFVSAVRLRPGEHQYKFVVDGEWFTDPAAPRQVPNAAGSLNSAIVV